MTLDHHAGGPATPMSERLHIWSADRLLLCVPADVRPQRTDALRELFHADPTVDGVLEVLTADGLAATPPFVCAAPVGAGVRVVIRGELHAVAHGADGSALVLGAGRAASWNDDVVADIVRISVELDGGCFEWIAGVTAPAGAPAPAVERAAHTPAPVAPTAQPASPSSSAPPESRTLDEREFERLVQETAHGDAQADEAEPSPDPTPAPEAALDFSSLLDDTRHGAPAAPPSTPPTPAPPVEPRAPAPPAPPVPEPEPVPAPDPTLPTGVVPPRPATRPPISEVPPSRGTSPVPPTAPEPPAGPGTGLGEHDGRTVTLADLRRMQQEAADGTGPEPRGPGAAPPGDAPARQGEVRAVRCPAGHANPPTAATCRICDVAIDDPAVVTMPRPVIARLVFDSGLVVDVDRPQLIGRRPSAPPEADEIPNLVTIPSPESDISRAHTAIHVEGWDLLVEDVGSTNGTEVRLPAREPVRLREHDPVLVVPGTEVTLAGAVRFHVERPEA